MEKKHKVILVKVVISLSAVLGITLFISLGILEAKVYGSNNKNVENIALVLFIIFGITTIIMAILMSKIDIRPERVPSTKYRIKVNDYNTLKKRISESLESEGYSSFKTYQGDLYTVDYAIKEKYGNTYIVGMLNLPELTEEILQKYKDGYFEDFGNHLIETKEINGYKDFNVIYVICVDRENPTFCEYTEGNVKQYFGRYFLPVGISFTSKILYVATQKEGIAIARYKSLKRLFLTYISDLIKREP